MLVSGSKYGKITPEEESTVSIVRGDERLSSAHTASCLSECRENPVVTRRPVPPRYATLLERVPAWQTPSYKPYVFKIYVHMKVHTYKLQKNTFVTSFNDL